MYWLTVYVHRNTSLFVARTPPLKSRIPDCHKNVENGPVGGGRARFPYTARGFGDTPRRTSVAKPELTTTNRT